MSKTVKRVSKTVKRVMIVMMVGMVAMLGVKAEAHYVVIRGQCYWHSGQCVRQDSDVPPDAITNPARGELVVGLPLVLSNTSPLLLLDILCPNGSSILNIDLSNTVDLRAETPIVPGNITNVIPNDPNNSDFRYAEWEVNVSHAPFLDTNFTTFLNTNFCSANGVPVPPRDVIIRAMSVKMNLYCPAKENCTTTTPPTPHSSLETTCTLSSKYNFVNYPKHFPTRGVSYDCFGTARCHQDVVGGAEKCVPQPPP